MKKIILSALVVFLSSTSFAESFPTVVTITINVAECTQRIEALEQAVRESVMADVEYQNYSVKNKRFISEELFNKQLSARNAANVAKMDAVACLYQ